MCLVSIVVPVYNVEKYLNRCVDSLVKQTYANIEIILVDDGSPDMCPGMCDSWAHKDERVKVIHKQNGGLSDARNAGMQEASGEYIAFVDSDDWVEETFIIELLMLNCDVAIAGTRLVGENDEVISLRGHNCEFTDGVSSVGALIDGRIFPTACDKLYKMECVKNIPFLKGKTHEDEFWSWKVLLNANSVRGTNKPLYNYLQHSNSIMGTGYSLKRLHGLEARQERMLYFQNNAALAKTSRCALMRDCLYHYQCALRFLDGEPLKVAVSEIENVFEMIPMKIRSISGVSVKNAVWLYLTIFSLKKTAQIRNCMRIGF